MRNYTAASTFELKEESEKGRWGRNRVRCAMNLDAAPVGMGSLGVACELDHLTGVSSLQSIQGHSSFHLPVLARSPQRFATVRKDESAPQPPPYILSTVHGYEIFEKEAQTE